MSNVARIPLGACSPGEHLAEELKARGWTSRDLAMRMAIASAPMHELAVDFLLAVSDKSLIVDKESSRLLGVALGVSEDLFANLSQSWSASASQATRATDDDGHCLTCGEISAACKCPAVVS